MPLSSRVSCCQQSRLLQPIRLLQQPARLLQQPARQLQQVARRPLCTSPGGKDQEEKIVIPWLTISFTVAVLGAYVAYFYLIEQPGLVEEELPKELPSGVHRALPDGRLLMADGSIRAAAAPESTAGFVAAPTFQGAKAGMCFKRGPAGQGYYQDQPLHARAAGG